MKIMTMTKLSLLPTTAGIYLFKDQNQQVIYIGKAKSLRKRVSSYFKPAIDDRKVTLLRQEIADITYIITKSETEALLLEAQLIKEHQPKFNVLLKEGQPFVYLLFTRDELPRLELVRNKKRKGTYFGPFLHKTDARKAHDYLLKTFRLKHCNKTIKNGCLDYHLGFCAGTCTGTIEQEDYCFRITLAQQALQGNHKKFLNDLKQRIALHAINLCFEQARALTHYLHHFQTIFDTLRTHFTEQKYAHEAAVALNTVPIALQIPAHDLAQQLQQFLGLKKPIYTIDCFDISHIQGQAIVGSCIRFTHGKPEKNKFRRFKVRTLHDQNDYAALQEVVTRRYKHGDLPDLVLIDGGKGQRNAIVPLVSVPCVSLAKKEELLLSDQFREGVPLQLHSTVGKLFIALRDYAHHFAITYHRLVRRRERLQRFF
jgi:excinuclease ABC subunit C